jgi:quercetin dioxygenase-like cupin family protein
MAMAIHRHRDARPGRSRRAPATEETLMELIRADEVKSFANSGVTSRQLLFPENSRSARLTITRVTVQPGARNPPHRHATSEQVWVALRGGGQLLLAGGVSPFAEGDVARFEDGELHGFENTGASEFEYVSVTSPPLNFRAAYERAWPGESTP